MLKHLVDLPDGVKDGVVAALSSVALAAGGWVFSTITHTSQQVDTVDARVVTLEKNEEASQEDLRHIRDRVDRIYEIMATKEPDDNE